MKATTYEDQARNKKYLTLEMTPDEIMSAKSPDFIWRQVIDKASDKLLEEIYPELQAKFREKIPELVAQVNGEIVTRGVKRLAELKEKEEEWPKEK